MGNISMKRKYISLHTFVKKHKQLYNNPYCKFFWNWIKKPKYIVHWIISSLNEKIEMIYACQFTCQQNQELAQVEWLEPAG